MAPKFSRRAASNVRGALVLSLVATFAVPAYPGSRIPPAAGHLHTAGENHAAHLTGALAPNQQQQQRPAAPAPTPGITTAAPIGPTASGPQSEQGQQYGRPGFVGEPINLNVVNADVRDILNYITEQYGVNFVVDSSVQRVPVTINVTDVPWNFALNSIVLGLGVGFVGWGMLVRVGWVWVVFEEAQIRADEE
ncbi:MAG: hypothetical protein ACRD9R_13830, partial [Pyrinomonadaceae bacterium]